MGCRFPGAPDLAAFARLLLEGRSSIGEFPRTRFDPDRFYDPTPGAPRRSYSRIGAWVDDRPIDTAALGLTDEEAAAADTLHLWVLEVAHATLVHAGLDPFGLRGRNVGVVLGHARGSIKGGDLSFSAAIESLLPDLASLPVLAHLDPDRRHRIQHAVAAHVRARYPVPHSDRPLLFRASEAAGLVARTFGLTGRHLVTDAACASSLAALDVAVRALRQGHLDMALVGGASFTSPFSMVLFSQARALSAEGSFPFDARANGFVCSEGVGMVLLARLDDAVAEGRRIYGLIHGVGASSDGRGKGLWAPNSKGQVLALAAAYARSGIAPSAVDYIEAHGTSTALGDATEVASLTEFFEPHVQSGQRIAIGSIKSNLGHARESAGIASLLKVLVAFAHDTIPASINYEQPNPHIDWEHSPLVLASQSRPWPRGERPRVAGIDSFGIGGLNYHVIVEEPPDAARLVALGGAAKPSTRSHSTAEPVALVGIGCLLPGARGVSEFWSHLQQGRSAIGPAPLYGEPGDAPPPDSGSPWGAIAARAAGISGFEANWRRYRMPPRTVEHTDPLHLMLLECALDALDDAGIDVENLDRTRIATTVGTVFGSDYGLGIELALRLDEAADALRTVLVAEGLDETALDATVDAALDAWRRRLPQITEDSSGNASASPLASRVAMTLDLHGATCAVDAGQASSLASLEIACESLWARHADVAIWAGADRGLSLPRFLDAARLGRLSLDGRSASFEAAADDLVLGEGVVVGVLMRLADAQAAGRRVYAVIAGVGSASAMAGNEHSHAPLVCAMDRAHARAGTQAEGIRFIEGVGAGRPDTDAALARAAKEVLAGRTTGPLFVGSLTGSIGHAQGASGAAAIVKAALALDRRLLPRTVGVSHRSPSLADEIEVCVDAVPLEPGHVRSAVSAWGAHGASYHVVLESAPRHASVPVVFRAPSRRHLDELLATHATNAATLTPGATLGHGPVAAGLRPGGELAARIGVARRMLGSPSAGVVLPGAAGAITDYTLPADTCFMFSGQGSQYPGMMRAVAAAYPAAAARLRDVDAALERCGERALSEVMWERTDLLGEVLWTQMAVLGGDLMMLEVARHHGLEPQLVTGHSYGDYPALVAAGAWTIDEVVHMTVVRCQSILDIDLPGGMVAVFTSRSQVAELLAGIPGYAVESNINSPDEVIVSGEPASLDELLVRCQAAGVTARRLPVPRAFHCELLRPAVPVFEAAIGDIPFRTPRIPFMTSSGATVISTAADIRTALIEQFTRPVDFIAQIESAYAAGCRRFVEIGPGRVLARLAIRILAERPAVVVSLDDRKLSGLDAIEAGLAVLAAYDVPADRAFQPTAPAMDAAEPARRADATALAVAGPMAPGEVRFVDATTQRGARGTNAPARRTPTPAVARQDVEATAPDASSTTSARTDIETCVVEFVCDASGYPFDLVSLDADLEADLGIDTVKQAQILGRVRERYDLPTDEDLAIRAVPTPRHIADYVERARSGTHQAPDANPALPIAAASNPRAADAGEPAMQTVETSTGTSLPAFGPAVASSVPGTSDAATAVRYVTRLDDQPLASQATRLYCPARIIIVGSGALAVDVGAALGARGTMVVPVSEEGDPEQLVQAVRTACAEGVVPDLLLLTGTARRTAQPETDDWEGLAREGSRLLEVTFRITQEWVRELDAQGRLARHADLESGASRPTLTAVTALGGGLGHINAARGLPEGGGVIGLLKDLRHEYPALRVTVLDTERGEQAQVVTRALLAELDADDDLLETGLLRGHRLIPRLTPAPVPVDPERLRWLQGLTGVVLTGGARGITAEVAVRLATMGVKQLHLIGRTTLPPEVEAWSRLDDGGLEALRQSVLDDLRTGRRPRYRSGPVTPAEWDEAWKPMAAAVDVRRNLQRIAEAGGRVSYHPCDVGDAEALRAVLERIRNDDGPIRMVVHGAGHQVSRAFLSKGRDELLATLAPKLQGTVNLITLTAGDPLEAFVGFGSVAGRFGGLGQADYSMACDLLARATGALQAARPSCRVVTVAWPGWDGVGMAARTRHLFDAGVRGLMPVEEGCQHLISELLARHGESEVVIATDLGRLDSDHQHPRDEAAMRQAASAGAATALPLVDLVVAASPDAVSVECRLDADRDPFLREHRHGRTAIVPAVVSLELMAEAARLVHPDGRLEALENVVIAAGVKLSESRTLPLVCTGVVCGADVHLSIRAHHVGREARLLTLDRTRVTSTARFGGTHAGRLHAELAREAADAALPPLRRHLPGSHPLMPTGWHHGPIFLTLQRVALGERGLHRGTIRALSPAALRPWAPDNWWVPAPLLDGCLALCVEIVRTRLQVDGLPIAFGSLRVLRQPAPGELCDVIVRERGHDDRRVHFDFAVTGRDRSPVLEVENYVLRTSSRIRDARSTTEAPVSEPAPWAAS